jgi:hypothetical protein
VVVSQLDATHISERIEHHVYGRNWVGALVVVREWPRSAPTHQPAAVPSTFASVVEPTAPQPTTTPPPWPTSPGACNEEISLPIVSSTPRGDTTGIRLLLGGDRLRIVDFDSGQATALTAARLRPGEYITQLAGAATTYATTRTCTSNTSRVLRIGANARISVVASLGLIEWMLADGDRAWVVSNPSDVHHPYGFITPLGGSPRVRLPDSFYPDAIVNGTLTGSLAPDPSAGGSLVLVDARTGHLQTNLGRTASTVATGSGLIIWSDGCYGEYDKPCLLHRRSVATGATTPYHLPRPAFTGIVSPDGREVALTLERAAKDPRFTGHPIPPSDVAILHLDTGKLEIIPGIEVPAKIFPTLAFSADGHWLVIALDAGTKTRLLAWRSGLAHPYESTPITEQALDPPPILVPPSRGGS